MQLQVIMSEFVAIKVFPRIARRSPCFLDERCLRPYIWTCSEYFTMGGASITIQFAGADPLRKAFLI